MNDPKKQEKLLNSLSEIDDEIVEKVAVRRFHLWMRWKQRQKKRNLIVRTTAAAACFCIMLTTLFVVLLGRDGGSVPIYQGMTVMNSAPVETKTVSKPKSEGPLSWMMLSASALPHEEKNKNTLKVDGAYYAKQHEDIYILIHIDNPDNYEILSFTLNGQKYSSYMFEEGSDMETLILKYNVGDAEGIVEYTIDAIKYVDGTKIKDVRMDGDRTVAVGIYSEKQPNVTLTEETLSFHEIAWKFTLRDPLDLMKWSDGSLRAELYEGSVKVREQTMETSTEGELRFSDLTAGQAYTVKLFGIYDELDGMGVREHLLCEREYRTPGVVMLDRITVGQESIGFSVRWDERYEPKDLVSFLLYDGATAVRSLTADTTEISGLLSDHEYRLVLEYRKSHKKTATVVYTVRTEAKLMPSIALENLRSTQSEIFFAVAKNDPDQVGRISAMELWLDGTRFEAATDLSTVGFAGLLSNNRYTVRITYSYDLNDGEGMRTMTEEASIHTKAKADPVFNLTAGKVTHTSVDFALSVRDPDHTEVTIAGIELFLGNKVVQTAETLEVRRFEGLLSGKEYTIRVTYTYDLGDGTGVRTETQDLTISTLAKKAPTLELTAGEASRTTVEFALSVRDPDQTEATVTKFELLLNGKVVQTAETLEVRRFEGLLSGNEYTIRVTYTYDLGDGTGMKTETQDLTVSTLAKKAPTLELTAGEASQTTVDFALSVRDPDQTEATVTKLELLLNGKVVQTAETLDVRRFEGLLSGKEYTIRVTYTCDLDDGMGVRTECEEFSVATLAQTVTLRDVLWTGTGTVKNGDREDFLLQFNNPDGVEILSVTVNGKVYPLRNLSGGRYSVEILVDSEGGMYDLQFTALTYRIFGEIEQTLSFTEEDVFIVRSAGEVRIESVSLDKTYWKKGETLSATIIFAGTEGLRLKSVYVGRTECWLTYVDDTTYTVELVAASIGESWYDYGVSSFRIDAVSYEEQGSEIVQELNYGEVEYLAGLYRPTTVVEIRTPDDLQNMTNGNVYYKLMNDIDLTGYDWKPYPLLSILDGNGYTVRNLTLKYVNEIPTTGGTLYVGMFTVCESPIFDLTIENASITLIMDQMQRSSYVGILAGASLETLGNVIYRCNVSGEIFYMVSEEWKEGFSRHNIGGIVGSMERGYYCHFDGTIVMEGMSREMFDIHPISGLKDTYEDDGYHYGCTANATVIVNGITEDYTNTKATMQ